ncbi:MAG: hypothetical protein ACTSPD_10430 [Promethearchaeota archaeon]
MIIKGNSNKRYNKDEFKNKVRRCTKIKIDRHFLQLPYRSKAVDLLLYIPGVKKVMDRIISISLKLINYAEKKKLTINKRKELSTERRKLTHDITISK